MATARPLIIIGSGPAGLTAGIYAARANLRPLIIDGPTPGGQLITTSLVENWPGEKSIMGPTLMKNMREHSVSTGCEFLSEKVIRTNFSQSPFTITTDKQKELHAYSIIVATGATPKKLHIPGENMYWGKGVTSCAVCDGAFYKDLPIVIIGGGDTAMEFASFMVKFTDQITIITITEKFTATAAMQEPVLRNNKITIIYNSTATTIKGDGQKVQEIVVLNKKTNATTTLATAAVFVAIGLTPNTNPFQGQLTLDNHGYLVLTTRTHTSVPGIFGAGDVSDPHYRQAISAAGAGCMAAMDAERYLSDRKYV